MCRFPLVFYHLLLGVCLCLITTSGRDLFQEFFSVLTICSSPLQYLVKLYPRVQFNEWTFSDSVLFFLSEFISVVKSFWKFKLSVLSFKVYVLYFLVFFNKSSLYYKQFNFFRMIYGRCYKHLLNYKVTSTPSIAVNVNLQNFTLFIAISGCSALAKVLFFHLLTELLLFFVYF